MGAGEMNRPVTGEAARTEASGLCELGRYAVPEGTRVLIGRRVDGVVHVLDWPADGHGRRYHVEAGFGSMGELAVLAADYRRRAESLGVCPMSRAAIERGLAMERKEASYV